MIITQVPDREAIIKAFVNNFILKDKKERCLQQLLNPKKRGKFTELLNHKWESILNMKYLVPVEPRLDNMQETGNMLALKENEACYLISDTKEYDDLLLPFGDIPEEVYGSGYFGTMVINTNGNRVFLQTEASKEGTSRFIGKRI